MATGPTTPNFAKPPRRGGFFGGILGGLNQIIMWPMLLGMGFTAVSGIGKKGLDPGQYTGFRRRVYNFGASMGLVNVPFTSYDHEIPKPKTETYPGKNWRGQAVDKVRKVKVNGKVQYDKPDIQHVAGLRETAGQIFTDPNTRTAKTAKGIGAFAQRTFGKGSAIRNNRVGGAVMDRVEKISATDAIQLGVSGLNIINATRGHGHRIEMVQHINEVLTGYKPTKIEVLMGSKKLHPLAKQSRKEMYMMGVASAFEVAANGFLGYVTLFPDKTPKPLQFGPLGNPMGRALVSSGLFMIPGLLKKTDALGAYQQAHRTIAAGMHLEAQHYKALVEHFAPRIDPAFSQQMVDEFVKRNSTIDDVIKELAAGLYPNAPIGKWTNQMSANGQPQLAGANWADNPRNQPASQRQGAGAAPAVA